MRLRVTGVICVAGMTPTSGPGSWRLVRGMSLSNRIGYAALNYLPHFSTLTLARCVGALGAPAARALLASWHPATVTTQHASGSSGSSDKGPSPLPTEARNLPSPLTLDQAPDRNRSGHPSSAAAEGSPQAGTQLAGNEQRSNSSHNTITPQHAPAAQQPHALAPAPAASSQKSQPQSLLGAAHRWCWRVGCSWLGGLSTADGDALYERWGGGSSPAAGQTSGQTRGDAAGLTGGPPVSLAALMVGLVGDALGSSGGQQGVGHGVGVWQVRVVLELYMMAGLSWKLVFCTLSFRGVPAA